VELTVYFVCDAGCWGEDGVIAELSEAITRGGVAKAVDGFMPVEAFGVCLLGIRSLSGCVGMNSVACVLGDAGDAVASVPGNGYCGVQTSNWVKCCREKCGGEEDQGRVEIVGVI
jgi:hypothetical protein